MDFSDFDFISSDFDLDFSDSDSDIPVFDLVISEFDSSSELDFSGFESGFDFDFVARSDLCRLLLDLDLDSESVLDSDLVSSNPDFDWDVPSPGDLSVPWLFSLALDPWGLSLMAAY